MHWKLYAESAGRPPSHEIVIRHDARDEGHPFIVDRIGQYEGQGKKVVLVPIERETKP